MRRAVVSLFLVIVAFGAAWGQEPEEKPVSAVIELNRRVYYAGDPFNVRISIVNNTREEVGNPIKNPLSQGFKVRVAGDDRVTAEGEPGLPEPHRHRRSPTRTNKRRKWSWRTGFALLFHRGSSSIVRPGGRVEVS